MITVSRTTQETQEDSKVHMPDLSIVIVSWNTKKYMEECLTSLCTIDGNLSAEVIVVDNASADGTPEMIRAQFPGVKLIETGANLGFAKGNKVSDRKIYLFD
jgi:N-acetylglucosaminyl-diphospho-decaprenol L-rhamnosyltransferase